jgi:argininosuccinate lyase
MADNQRDTFSSRLSEQPARAQIEHYRRPNFSDRLEYLWQPLLALNRSQAITLSEVDVLDPSEASSILDELDVLEERIDPGEFDDYNEFEGPYFLIEDHLLDTLGEEIGGKLHTGRSRNDLYSAAFRIAVRERILNIMEAVLELRDAVLRRASESTDVVFPAFTHSQPAQPITFAHYLLAFDNLLGRDFERLKHTFELTNESPLGAAAIGGTGFPLDRDRLAKLSGFSDVIYNTFDAIASVDYLPQATTSVAILMTNISRVSQDLLVWSMLEVGFIELSEQMSNVSSIMPQKKNPGVIEKTRARAGEAIGEANSTLASLKAVPFGDVGETSYGAMPFLRNVDGSIRAIRTIPASIER